MEAASFIFLCHKLKGENIMEQSIIHKYGSLEPSRILRYFLENDLFKKEHEKEPYTFIILGRGGPTGKTWLCTGLRKYGFMAFELSESVFPFIDYNDNGNHVIKDDIDKNIIIILNQPLRSDV